MYNIDDLIVYGKTGVYRIKAITTREDLNYNKDQLYYVLQPLHESYVIYTPIDTTVFMRPIISPEEAARLIDTIPAIQPEAYCSERSQELAEHYEAAIKTHNCSDLIKLTMSLYSKKQLLQQQNRKFGEIDKYFMKQAEELLFGEISLALDIPRDNVQAYIASRVQAKSSGIVERCRP